MITHNLSLLVVVVVVFQLVEIWSALLERTLLPCVQVVEENQPLLDANVHNRSRFYSESLVEYVSCT